MSSPSSQNTVPIRPPNPAPDQQNASHSDTPFVDMRNDVNISSEEESVEVDILEDSEHADIVDMDDDYDEDQDQLQVLPADKRTFCELQSNNLLASNASSNDLPSLKQINRPVRTTARSYERDRRYNRRTAGVLSGEQQSKAYNAWIASHKSRLQALTVDNLRQVHSDLIPIQEIAMYRYVKNVVNAIFSEDMKIMFSTAIEQLPLRGVFNLCFNSERRLTLKWHKMSIFQLRNLIEMLYKKMERSALKPTSSSQEPKEFLQELVKNQIITLLKVDNPQLLKTEEFLKLKTDFTIALQKDTAASALFLTADTQQSLTQYAHDFLKHRAKSVQGGVASRVQQLTTILDSAWFNGSGIYKRYKDLQSVLYTFVENLRLNLLNVLQYAFPSYEEVSHMDSKSVLTYIFIIDKNRIYLL